MSTEKFDVIVVGAGVAGGIFAASQPDNVRVLVVERDLTEPDRIVGELMQPGGVAALQQLNLSFLLEDIDAQPVHGYNLVKRDQHFLINYDEVEKGIQGLGLRNGRFLTKIRTELERKENVTLVQGNVTDILEENGIISGVTYKTKEGETKTEKAPLTVVCDGPISLLRSKLSKVHKKVSSYFIGLILKDLNLEFPDYGHMILTGDAPILVYPVHTNAYRILIDYPGTKPPRLGQQSRADLKEEVSKVLPPEMVTSFHNAIDEGDIKVMPNHYMNSQALPIPGGVLLGDSLNMRHPITGGGMTAVFSDIICLNQALANVNLHDQVALQAGINQYYKSRRKGVSTINILADALYQSFMDPDMKEAVFEYLKKGGNQAVEPLSILSGINKNKAVLLKHFLKVATQDPKSLLKNPGRQLHLYKKATQIIYPLLKEEEQPAIV